MDEKPMSDCTFEQFLNEDKLMGSRCTACDVLYVPPRAMCPQCHCSQMKWVEMEGTGKLAAFTVISIGPPSMIEEGHDRNNPYCSGVVRLDEGPRVVGRIQGVDTLTPENIEIGTALKVKFLHRGTNESHTTVLAFTPL